MLELVLAQSMLMQKLYDLMPYASTGCASALLLAPAAPALTMWLYTRGYMRHECMTKCYVYTIAGARPR